MKIEQKGETAANVYFLRGPMNINLNKRKKKAFSLALRKLDL